MSTFRQVLERLGGGADKGRKGALFERLIQRYLRVEGVYAARFNNVWLWSDRSQPLQDNPDHAGQDYGVDLVAEEINGGGLCAIQCKFYGRDRKLDWKGLTKFLSAASYKKSPFTSLILVYTGGELTENQMKEIEKHECELVTYSDLAKSHVDWEKIEAGRESRKDPHKEMDHQRQARENVVRGLATSDRGKLIMACGTGKTFTTLRIAEEVVGKDGVVLYLVPSISLMSQAMREWASHRILDHRYIGVCSDTRTGRDDEDASLSELPLPVTTDPQKISKQLDKRTIDTMTVLFSTYQSLFAVSEAQKEWKGVFDLVICDEAHRTTGASVEDGQFRSGRSNRKKGERSPKDTVSYFHAIHDDKHIRARKRLYTTATPKVYNSRSKKAVKNASEKFAKDFEVYSMDDEEKYGKDLYCLKFSDAINQNLLTDYKVVVLTVTEAEAATAIEEARTTNPKMAALNVSNTARMIGCWKALRDPEAHSYVFDEGGQPVKKLRRHPLQRAIAFSRTIADSQQFKDEFPGVVSADTRLSEDKSSCTVWHVDGRHNALERRNRLDWLEESADDPHECRVLTNAKCLTEGVDVPALDAVLFLSPRSSTIDIIQAVGRVMRTSNQKKYGYIVIPLVIKSDADVQTTLDDDEMYSSVWDVVRALRAHDDRIDQYLISGSIPNLIISPSPGSVGRYTWSKGEGRPISSRDWNVGDAQYEEDMKKLLDLIRTKIADKVGDRRYLESWAEDVAKIVGRIKERIPLTLKKPNAQKAFVELHMGLKIIINDSISEEEAIDMLAQHMIMGRIFDVLFSNGQFSTQNPISHALNNLVDLMKKYGLDAETRELETFYREIEDRIKSIHTHEGRQRVLYELYDKFFTNAFKRTAERLGIVYTPIEIVDFILKSADDVLYANFRKHISSKNVHVIDPFAGTGTFISRLINNELGLIQKSSLEYKYQNEIHANEIVLLAYYVAAVNCETTLLEILNKHIPFNGLILTDTFHTKKINEQWNEGMFTPTQKHIEKQRKSPITIIVGNPPWSKGDKTFTGDPKTIYPESNARLVETYIKKATTHDKKSLYDSYIRAIRWASDRIGKEGIIAFVTNAGFLRSDTSAGMRVCLEQEFNEIWCFDLRGNQRTKGEVSKQEGGKMFGSGSRASVAITILVRNPQKSGCVIRYKDIGDYLSREEKLKILKETASIKGIKNWQIVKPDRQYNCWLDPPPVDTRFNDYMEIGNKDTKSGKIEANAVFKSYSLGIATHRDAWVYNSSKTELIQNMKKTIKYCQSLDPNKQQHDEYFLRPDSTLLDKLKKSRPKFNAMFVRENMYRPFFSQWCYFDPYFVSAPYRIPQFFPNTSSENIVICTPYKFRDDFYVFATKKTPDLHIAHTGQCFPLYDYSGGHRQDNITNNVLSEYQRHYSDQAITKKQIFTYVYGLLNHPGYQSKFSSFLRRVLPRIPMVPDFAVFSNIGNDLMNLHLDYDTCKRYDLGKPLCNPKSFTKMSFDRTMTIDTNGKAIKTGNRLIIKLDGDVLFKNVPNPNYKINGRTPVEWVIDRYRLTTDKKSGIVNNPCKDVDIVAILERAVHVGLESERLITNLSKYQFEPSKDWAPNERGLDNHM